MTYQFFNTMEAATAFLAEIKAQGFRGYILKLSAQDYEVRCWA